VNLCQKIAIYTILKIVYYPRFAASHFLKKNLFQSEKVDAQQKIMLTASPIWEMTCTK